MLNQILAITGKPGLYQLISRGKNMLIVESLIDHKRMPTYARDKIVSLSDVSMYTTSEDIALSEVLTALGKKQSLQPVDWDIKKADNEDLRNFFAEVLPTFDSDRVYPSDIRKLLQWYNILIGAGITDFSVEEAQNEDTHLEAKQDIKQEQQTARKTQGKTQKKTTGASAKTGVGAKKG